MINRRSKPARARYRLDISAGRVVDSHAGSVRLTSFEIDRAAISGRSRIACFHGSTIIAAVHARAFCFGENMRLGFTAYAAIRLDTVELPLISSPLRRITLHVVTVRSRESSSSSI